MIDAEDFTAWHERRMAELNYPPVLREELRRARVKWLAWQAKRRNRYR